MWVVQAKGNQSQWKILLRQMIPEVLKRSKEAHKV